MQFIYRRSSDPLKIPAREHGITSLPCAILRYSVKVGSFYVGVSERLRMIQDE